MSSVQLLDKTRKIGRLLHNNNSSKVVFNDICQVMRDILSSSVIVISRKGKLLGRGILPDEDPITELIGGEVGEFIDKMLNEDSFPFFRPKRMSILIPSDLRRRIPRSTKLS